MCSWRGCCTLGANPLRNDTQCEHCEGTGCVESCNQNHSGAPECQIVEQYVYKVTKFSSQYGADKSISYAAGNLIGPPYVFPQHGDSTRTCVFVSIFLLSLVFQDHLIDWCRRYGSKNFTKNKFKKG